MMGADVKYGYENNYSRNKLCNKSNPGKIEPGEYKELCSTIDVFPTLLSAVGISGPGDVPGVDLLPLLKNHKPLERTSICGESYSHDIADLSNHEATLQYRWCIEGKWKLILSYECQPDRYAFVHAINDRQPQLFDLEADPHESKNRASENPDEVQTLAKHLQDTWHVSKPPIGMP